MKDTYSRSIYIIEGKDTEQGYGIRTEYSTNIPYNVAEIMFNAIKDYNNNKEVFIKHCKKDESNKYKDCFLDYCKILSKTKHPEIEEYVASKSFEDLTDFFNEYKIEKCKNSYFLDGEEISGQVFDEGLELGFTSWAETAIFNDNIENKKLLIKL